jgi:phage gpG-like protein
MNQANKLINDQKKVVSALGVITKMMGTEALKHYNKSFIDQGFTDDTLVKWSPRKGRASNRPILIKSGNLKNSLKILKISTLSVTVGSELYYADFHNEGIRSRLPKRQFVGFSSTLNNKIISKIGNIIENIFR